MKINVLIFGQLTDITGSGNLLLDDVSDTSGLIESLQIKYPALKQSKYLIAVDKKVITGNTVLNDKSTVALMPAFSGG